MPFFGFDDVLLLLASATALLWVKRGDVVQSGVYTALAITDSPSAEVRAEEAGKRAGSPCLLLRGFDLEPSEELAEEMEEALLTDTSTTTHMDAGGLLGHSAAEAFMAKPTRAMPSHALHRHAAYLGGKPHITTLLTSSPDHVRDNVGRYSPGEIMSLFTKMEKDGLCEELHMLCSAIDEAGYRHKFLTQPNVEVGLRMLLHAAKSRQALNFYFSYGEDMMLADEVLLALFDASRHAPEESLRIFTNIRHFQMSWSAAIYACCLTITARYDYRAALELYQAYLSSHRRAAALDIGAACRALASRGPPATSEMPKLHYLHHIIIPLVVEHAPETATRYLDDMLMMDAAVAPEVLLRCLHFPAGEELAELYLRREGCALPPQRAKADRRLVLAMALYQMKVSPLNLHTLFRLVMHLEKSSTATPNLMDGDVKPPPSSSSSSSSPSLSPSSTQHADVLVLQQLESALDAVPSFSSDDAAIIARTLTEGQASWGLTRIFMFGVLRRGELSAIPHLAQHAATYGEWSIVAKSMAAYLSTHRHAMTAAHIHLCVEAAVHLGRWSDVFFWIERGEARGVVEASSAMRAALHVAHKALRAAPLQLRLGRKFVASGAMQLRPRKAGLPHKLMGQTSSGAHK